MIRWPTVGEISLLIAVIASLPYIVKLMLYYFWSPELDVRYHNALKVSNRTSKLLFLTHEYRFDPHVTDINLSRISGERHSTRIIQSGDMVVKSDEYEIAPGCTEGLLIELDSGSTVTIRIFPRIHLSELGLPRFYGDVELRPIEHSLSVVEYGGMVVDNPETAKPLPN